MSRRVAINGMGRMGRLTLRQMMAEESLEVAAVNDIAAIEEIVYLCKHDSVYPDPKTTIRAEEGTLYWGDRKIPYLNEAKPEALPWGEYDVDLVVEATGLFRSRDKAALHLDAGAKKVIITAPGKDPKPDVTICMGVNEEDYDAGQHRIVSNGSCTTNCLAPVAMLLDEAFGIESGLMTTVHAYTNSQSLVDSPSKKHRRGRAGAISIIPTTTGAATAIAEVLPQLEGRMDGMAMRVPVADGSIVDLVVHTKQEIDTARVRQVLLEGSGRDKLQGILGTTDDELVSADIVGSEYSAMVDIPSTKTVGSRSAKVLAWYDNEWGYVCRVVDLARYMFAQQGAGASRPASPKPAAAGATATEARAT